MVGFPSHIVRVNSRSDLLTLIEDANVTKMASLSISEEILQLAIFAIVKVVEITRMLNSRSVGSTDGAAVVGIGLGFGDGCSVGALVG